METKDNKVNGGNKNSMRSVISKFYIKCILITIPFLLLIAYYVNKDPFLVIRPHSDYDHSTICLDEGAASWYKYKLYRRSQHYDSFIMGTSCTMAYRCEDWNKYIHAHPYRLFGNAEGLVDLYMKLDALDKQPNQPIKNLLLVFEQSLLSKNYMQSGPCYLMPPDVSHVSWLYYQMTFLQDFLDPLFLVPYLKFELTNRYEHSMKGIINPYGRSHFGYANDAIYPNEIQIRKMGERYWEGGYWYRFGKRRFVATPGKEFSRTIFKVQQYYLKRIKAICDKHHTNIKIVIAPILDRRKLNTNDVAIVRKIFGSDNVFDFSNSTDTSIFDKHNFYDGVHYRTVLGRKIINSVYSKKYAIK